MSPKLSLCRDNEHYIHGRYLSNHSPTCGKRWNFEDGKCVERETPQCLDGFDYNEPIKQCRSHVKPSCPNGSSLSNGLDVSNRKPQCYGSTFSQETGSCEKIVHEVNCFEGAPSGCCPKGMGWNDNVCQSKPINGKCPDGELPFKGWCGIHFIPEPVCPKK